MRDENTIDMIDSISENIYSKLRLSFAGLLAIIDAFLIEHFLVPIYNTNPRFHALFFVVVLGYILLFFGYVALIYTGFSIWREMKKLKEDK